MFEGITRGYLPPTYFSLQQVFKRKPPQLELCPYPNKIEVDAQRSYAILSNSSNKSTGPNKLQYIFAWMSTHPYIVINNKQLVRGDWTENIAVEAYESVMEGGGGGGERSYVMITFRAATLVDERTNYLMRSKGEDRRGRCPGPVTALLCRSGVDIQSVWQWLSLHRGHLAYVINEPGASGLLGVPSSSGARRGGSIGYRNVGGRQMSGRGRQQSMESLDSILPVYEPPPPSVHSSIPEDIRAEIDAMQTSDNQHQGQQSMEERRRMSIVSTTDESMSSDEDGGLQVLPLTLSLVLDFPTVLPPVYSDIAADTEYGRSYATRLAAVAGNTIFGSASGYVLQNAATILARSIAADLAAQQADQQADHNDSAGAGSIPSMAFLPTESAAEVESDILRDIVQLTRTFTQSMPMLNRLLSDDDAIAAIEESRRRAMATAAIGNNQAALRIAEQAVVDAAMAETLVGDHTRVPQISVGTVAGSGSAAAPSNDSGSGVVVSFEVGSWDTGDARSANSARSTRDSIDSSVLHAINGRVRRSRLSARTNPEYASSGGKKSSWLARLLHM